MRVCLFSSRVAAALVASQLIREGKKNDGEESDMSSACTGAQHCPQLARTNHIGNEPMQKSQRHSVWDEEQSMEKEVIRDAGSYRFVRRSIHAGFPIFCQSTPSRLVTMAGMFLNLGIKQEIRQRTKARPKPTEHILRHEKTFSLMSSFLSLSPDPLSFLRRPLGQVVLSTVISTSRRIRPRSVAPYLTKPSMVVSSWHLSAAGLLSSFQSNNHDFLHPSTLTAFMMIS